MRPKELKRFALGYPCCDTALVVNTGGILMRIGVVIACGPKARLAWNRRRAGAALLYRAKAKVI